MKPSSRSFSANARAALHDQALQQALGKARAGFVGKRTEINLHLLRRELPR